MKRIVLILAVSLITLSAGTVIAYKNTASLGYGEAQLISREGDSVFVMDYEIDLIEIEKETERILKELSEFTMPI